MKKTKVIILSLLLGGSFNSIAQATKIKDIQSGYGSSPAQFTVVGAQAYFSADDGVNNIQLWKTDKTEAGTDTVKIINRYGSADIQELIAFGSNLIFTANDSTHGQELWISDGTEAGTVMIKDINPGSSSSSPSSFLVYDSNTFYFSASDGAEGVELWKSDGTEAGTIRVKNINATSSNSGSSYPQYLTLFNNKVYFSCNDGVSGYELWETDGTENGTVNVENINTNGSGGVRELIVMGTELFFIAEDGTDGTEIWKTDGTPSGTTMVTDINTNGNSLTGTDSFLTVLGNELFFKAYEATNGTELWKTDGSVVGTPGGTVLVKDINTDLSGNSNVGFLKVVGSLIIFQADNGNDGTELWKTDGTSLGTEMITDINPSGNALPYGYNYSSVVLGADLYVSLSDGVHSYELWKTDGTPSGTVLVSDIQVGSGTSYIKGLTVFGNDLIFSANGSSTGLNIEPWLYQVSNQSIGLLENKRLQVSSFPNPTTGNVTIASSQEIEIIEILNLSGQTIAVFNATNTIDITRFTKGVYFARIKMKNSQSTMLKLVKE